jgi:hypothetical protein
LKLLAQQILFEHSKSVAMRLIWANLPDGFFRTKEADFGAFN